MNRQTRFVHSPDDKKRWEKAAAAWAKETGHPQDRALSAWIRVMLNKAADEQKKK